MGWFTLFCEMGKTEWARETIDCALDLGEEIYGVQGVRNALTHYKYGSFEASEKNYDNAISHYEKAIDLMKQQPRQFQSRIEMIEEEISKLDTLNHQNPYR
jgi:tetratricopeptide (TPR) repeat protein